jgi:hypothetical protein
MDNSYLSYFAPLGTLCMLWAAGLALALFRIKQAPRTAILFLIALLLFSGSAFSNAFVAYSAINTDVYQFFGRNILYINMFLRFLEPALQVIGWLLIIATFFFPSNKTSNDGPATPGKWEFSIKFNNKGNP